MMGGLQFSLYFVLCADSTATGLIFFLVVFSPAACPPVPIIIQFSFFSQQFKVHLVLCS